MAKTLEQLAKEIYDEYMADGEPCTMEECLEVAKQEMGAKKIKTYVQSDKPKEKKKREVKLDEVKVQIIKDLDHILDRVEGIDRATIKIVNPQKEISFRIGADEYSLSLIKHRVKKS